MWGADLPSSRLASALLIAFTFGIVTGARGQECADCHPEVAVAHDTHADLGCQACHQGLGGFPHPDTARAQARGACGQCHDVAAGLEASVHPALDCTECHGPAHQVRAASDPESTTSPLKQFQSCGRCHQADQRVARYLGSPHGKALLLKGLVSAPSCASCHGSHAIRPASDPTSRLSRQHAPETCGSCHRWVLEAWRDESAQGSGWVAGRDDAPVCTTCHRAHATDAITLRRTVLHMPDQCGDCHGERYSTYRDNFHGKATDLGFAQAAVCSDCHTPHRNLPADDPRSTVHPANLKATCGACHQDAGDSFVTFKPHIDPSDPHDSPPVYAVWLFMHGLLLAVFGFFAMHDLLWLQRTAVGWWRGEFQARPMDDGPYVRRFAEVHVWVHVVVVVTFLMLAATGLPLKYHWTPWAHSASALPGGLAVLRVLHRLAAIVTFGYLAFHVGHLAHRVLRRRESGLFWGWRSMVPRPRDAADLWANLRYFLYTAPRPRFDRWSYWEKFDYFAVFWGVPVIGLSGLMLWFPDVFTRWLPGWVLNAAFVVHSDEALLATGFIFVFHFFHTHLRPESFPLDPVVFTGSMPLERFREERPLEYERLLASGELDRHLVPAPTAVRLKMAIAFGVAALAMGLLLVVAIFWGILAT